MRKILLIVFFVLILTGCKGNPNSIVLGVLNNIEISSEINEDIKLPNEYKYKSKTVNAKWESNKPDILSNEGKITKTFFKEKVKLTVTLTLGDITESRDFDIYVLAMTDKERINKTLDEIRISSEIKSNIDLPTNINGVSISWSSSKPEVLNYNGVVGDVKEPTEVIFTATLTYRNTNITNPYIIKVLPLTNEEKLNKVIDDINIPEKVIITNLELLSTFPYGIKATWKSSDETLLSNQGIVTLGNASKNVTLFLTLILEGETMTKTFELTIGKTIDFNGHSYLERINDFDANNFTNVHIVEDRLVLKDDSIEGFYESNMILVPNFKTLVGSWSALSGVDSTVELLVKVKVGEEWSDYLSYQPWGLGRENKAFNQSSSNGIAKLSDDEISILNNNLANAIQYKAILRRTSLEKDSPKLSLISMALDIPEYSYEINDELPNFVDYEVPKLNQNIVPVIGNSICSPTSTTMLLKYKGHSFSEFDEYEHRYIANLARDYGNKIFGNWVFNTVTASAFGETSYVKRMYSFKELQHHLYTVGPVAASVKGDMQGLYSTNGHLIVVRGYRVTPEKTYVITNDPNLKDVYFEYDVEVFMNVWRNVIYVIE